VLKYLGIMAYGNQNVNRCRQSMLLRLTTYFKVWNCEGNINSKAYNTTLRPVVTCACKSRAMTEKDKVTLDSWERKVLKNEYGAVTQQTDSRMGIT
jgi:hypothetical protein